ncbi:MAG: peptidoglycan-binding protein [Microcoleus sp. PH2017_29_MFU_D_A]|jgi:YVTN family beta-propeller protein|uniref:peptidoglycan-binding protein n=1 Tax=unclassified Microcoleus TaxID=2642155 RepID=UPI001D2DDAEB|nr:MULTISPECIES: peptidoglycan-binding protein [unclassified Microcoleus]MCC3431540.1 peptidoglycan-binding protein [Microcoleus sp. PH2017_04_SCI_O_A]MCC3443694.1 peptidoglycan-binding protein [Microcoleus sp. PH2017_03_ELD_O_A]MCC3507062.1 peptidoglycan-binding protein [Microcoleus sp. PH2017_19_SFW_U_A]TAE52775.1 MAG: peptidoglycan-binding protein [Oscillatoriales cyanobacterium]MCC3452890.1 peptidoglycan-binding protein [Microcoleus sp. PH2017_08_TRC_O_A]
MDGLAYLHLAETWETPPTQTRSPNSKTHLNLAATPLLFFTISLAILNLVYPALAIRMTKGDSGPEVVEIQKTLQASGHFGGRATGFYGSVTQAAVKKFQADNKLKVDGIIGPQTLSALKGKSPAASADKESAEKTASKVDRPSPSPTPTENSNQLEDPTKNQPKQPLFEEPFLPPFKTETAAPTSDKKENELPGKRLANTEGKMTLKKTIYGKISPKSIVYSGDGLFFAQNMMYSHSITVYNRKFKLVKTISDTVNLSKFGFSKFKGNYKGSPVEAAFSTDGKYGYVSNYQMYGSGFDNPGSDRCSPSAKHDQSFLYRINTQTLKIEKIIPVGAVPKFNAVSPDNRFVLASNWCTWDLSVVDINKNREVERVKLGAYPRGIVVTPDSKNAYIAVMGSSDIAKVNLLDFSVEWLRNIGNAPRHLTIDPNGKYMYATLNGEGNVAKIDLATGEVIDKVSTGNAPRSMTISGDGKLIYVVNYSSNTVSKVRTSDLKVLQTVNVNSSPIGITYDPETNQVWVACYSGSIMVFQD